ncbi:MAG TPA: Spy/CpxP family protein refolding chaperone [Desulfobacterales bacterium]|nr:Spy/CpxP family protein refolding chaperone [Desulfobacterales bacterium]
MKKLATVLGIMLLVAVIAIPVSARGPGWGRGHDQGYGMGPGYGYGMGPGYGYGRGTENCGGFNLNLTAEQSAKIEALRETHIKEVTPLRNQIFSKEAELKLLWIQSNPDKNKIVSTQKEISDLQYSIKEKSTNYQLEISKVLTPEQKAKRLFSRSGKRNYPRSGICGNQQYGRGLMGR